MLSELVGVVYELAAQTGGPPVEAPPETVIYPEPAPPPQASTEVPPPTSPDAEFGM